jgi:hypothetical protein
MLLRMEVAAFHPLPERQRLVSVALFLAFVASRRFISGRALPGIPLCGARTFLSPAASRHQGSDGLADFE